MRPDDTITMTNENWAALFIEEHGSIGKYSLKVVFLQGSIKCVLIDWTSEFDRWFDKLENAAEGGDVHAQRQLDYVTAELQVLNELEGAPDHESATLMRVRQARRYPIWRVSHPYDADVAMRLIVWFPDDEHAVIVAFAGDKARIGDAFYISAGTRADAAIDQWKREVER